MQEPNNTPPKKMGGSMLNQKTNEDFNKKMPDPEDPNEEKDQVEVAPPSFEFEGTEHEEGETSSAGNESQKPPNKSEGSE